MTKVVPTVDTGGNVAEVEGIPQCPDVNEHYDEATGECNITFKKCDCSPEHVTKGCSMCNRAHEIYIRKMVKTGVVKPDQRIDAKAPYGNGKVVTFFKNKMNTVFLHIDEDLECAKDNWWFRFLKEIPAQLWNVTVDKSEYPCAFALYEATGQKKPERVLVNSELPMVWVFPNMYYVIAPCLQRPPEEIKDAYLKSEEKANMAEEIKARAEAELKERQDGKMKAEACEGLVQLFNEAAARLVSMSPEKVDDFNRKLADDMRRVIIKFDQLLEPEQHTRPVIPTKVKRQQYRNRRPTERKIYTTQPQQLPEVHDEQDKNVYHTTRGVKVRH